ncbi:MAG: cupin domain-containing protein [Mycobacterium sp.]
MEFIRPFVHERAADTGYSGYRAQFLWFAESALMIASYIEEGGCGPDLHYHHCDQIYFLIEGNMNVRLGDDTHSIGPNTLVFIPAGLPHCNWNDGPGAETHFEVLAPSPAPGSQIAIPVSSEADIPLDRRARHRGFVQTLDPNMAQEPMTGFRIQPLIDPGNGSTNAMINYAEVDPGSGGPGTHIHEFDQYYLVLEGTLTVEVALETYRAGSRTLAVLPAGVPHRQYNNGTVTEKHLTILAPPPAPDKPWDRGVELTTTGEDLVGISTSATSS